MLGQPKSTFSKKEEHMGNARVTKIEGPLELPIVLEEESVKRLGTTRKRLGVTPKRLETMEQYSAVGAAGDYTVTLNHNARQYTIKSTIAIKVLDHGELNLITDSGRWFLFAADSWASVFPVQPEPGE
jgi:hypothetical protein